MTDARMALVELLQKSGEPDFLRAVLPPDAAAAHHTWRQVADQPRPRWPKLAGLIGASSGEPGEIPCQQGISPVRPRIRPVLSIFYNASTGISLSAKQGNRGPEQGTLQRRTGN